MLTGYRTIIVNSLALLWSIGSEFGIVVPEQETTAVSVGALAVAGIVLRFLTKTPVGQKTP